jgi:hypothetical protein
MRPHLQNDQSKINWRCVFTSTKSWVQTPVLSKSINKIKGCKSTSKAVEQESLSSPAFGCYVLFWLITTVINHCSLKLHFPKCWTTLDLCISSLMKGLFVSLACFLIGLLLTNESWEFLLYSRQSPYQIYDLLIFFPALTLLFILLAESCTNQKFLILMRSSLLIFFFYGKCVLLWVVFLWSPLWTIGLASIPKISLNFFSKSFIVLCFKLLIHLISVNMKFRLRVNFLPTDVSDCYQTLAEKPFFLHWITFVLLSKITWEACQSGSHL